MAARHDLAMRRGNNPPVTWRFKGADGSAFDLTGSVMVLAIVWSGGSIEKFSDGDDGLAHDDDGGVLTFAPTLAETRLLPVGRVARYEIERRIDGTQVTLVEGWVEVEDGLPGDDDEDEDA